MYQVNIMSNPVITLFKNLMNYFCEIESKSTSEYLYYTHTEFDSNQTEFEALSCANKIVLKTKIQIKYVPYILAIFHSVYEKYDDGGFAIDMFTEGCYPTDYDAETLKKYVLDDWIDVIEKHVSSVEPIMENDKIVGVEEELVWYDVPKVEPQYYPGNKTRQKVYTLQDIYDMIVNDMNV
jgi:hypothetical protein